MSGTFDLPNAKEAVLDVIGSTPEDMTLRDMRRHINKELKRRDPAHRDVSADIWSGLAVTVFILAAIVFYVNS